MFCRSRILIRFVKDPQLSAESVETDAADEVVDKTDGADVASGVDVASVVDAASGVDVMLVLGYGLELVVWIGMDAWLEAELPLAPDELLEMDVEAWLDVGNEDDGAFELADDCGCPHCNCPLSLLQIVPIKEYLAPC